MNFRRRQWVVVSIALIHAVLMGGCVTIPYGSPARQSRLEQLKPGLSTPSDVLLALGEPRGAGALRWSPALEPRKIWYYEYIALGIGKIDTKMLLVFFHQDRYDGYLWFSSTNLVDKP